MNYKNLNAIITSHDVYFIPKGARARETRRLIKVYKDREVVASFRKEDIKALTFGTLYPLTLKEKAQLVIKEGAQGIAFALVVIAFFIVYSILIP